ncbi:hypothetical protein SCHIN_v1c03890 [Spiroplasma chinense]|uniref:J domain-containing protein n=1 Tax=Spiroplasma chinense TaxID=216932 RepID=A0A5B9Y4H7_9MOLU|nr:J domain-containing protein [Spiroplasma chinense]QEH61586.1 hypothetical protein SCHIN_v1c03890 [Spiroplasma chinense]
MDLLTIVIIAGTIAIILLIFLMTFATIMVQRNQNYARVRAKIRAFRKIFVSKLDKIIKINGQNYAETFNIFPFMSNFSETYKHFKSKGLVSFLKRVEYSFLKEYKIVEEQFFDFNYEVSKELGLFNTNIVKNYNKFVSRVFESYRRTFISEVIPLIIAKYEKKSYGIVQYEMADSFIDKEYNIFIENLDIILNATLHAVATQTDDWETDFDFRNYKKVDFKESLKPLRNDLLEAYKILGVTPSDSDASIKRNYRRLSKQYHPDREGTGSEIAFMKVVEAFNMVRKYRDM